MRKAAFKTSLFSLFALGLSCLSAQTYAGCADDLKNIAPENISRVIEAVKFPDPAALTNDQEVVANEVLSVGSLLGGYRVGVFPWPDVEGQTVPWYFPRQRGILRFSDLHIPKSLQRTLKSHKYEVTFNRDFAGVIQGCSEAVRYNTKREPTGTWITSNVLDAYTAFHRAGFAHSVEVWETQPDGSKLLVGGAYGVMVDGVFAGESMFHRRNDTSKIAFVHLVRHLESLGLTWMDIQMVSPTMEKFGGIYVPREEYWTLLQEAHRSPIVFRAP